MASSAQAAWGPGGYCTQEAGPHNHHCYALAYRTERTNKLASIMFIDATNSNVPGWQNGDFYDDEEWISFGGEAPGWIETGQTTGEYMDCCSLHPFYAEQQKGVYKQYVFSGTVEGYTLNHYVLFDSEDNGRWHIYWGCCEVGYYGGGWPTHYQEQEAGVEAAANTEPSNWMHDEVAASNGGAWEAWSPASWYTTNSAMCIEHNHESPAEGNIAAGTCTRF